MKNFKPSGVDWIGDIPAHWKICRLKYVVKCRNGLTYTPFDMVDEAEGTLVLRASNIKDGKLVFGDNVYVNLTNEKFLVRRGDILICSCNGSRKLVGKCALIDEDIKAYFGSFMMICRCENPKYIFHVLNSDIFNYYAGSFTTTTIYQLTKKTFGEMRIPLPPFDEQEKIAAYLDKVCGALDREIKIQRALIEKLRVYKKSLVSETVTGGLNPNVQKKFSGVDWLGDIPAHWQLIKLKFVARNNIETLSERTAGDTPIKYIDIGSVDYSDGVKKIQEFIFEDAPTRARRVLHEGDTIISTVRTYLKAIAYIEKIFDGHIGSTGFAVLMPREKIFGKFLYYAVSSAPFIGAVEANSFGVSYPAVNDSILKNLKFALPPRDEQEKIAAFLDRKCQRIDENISKRTALVARLTEYKKSLIYETVTGKREV